MRPVTSPTLPDEVVAVAVEEEAQDVGVVVEVAEVMADAHQGS